MSMHALLVELAGGLGPTGRTHGRAPIGVAGQRGDRLGQPRRRRRPARAGRSPRRRPPGGSRGCRWPRSAGPWRRPPWRRGGSPRGARPARTGPCRRRGRSTSSRSPSTTTSRPGGLGQRPLVDPSALAGSARADQRPAQPGLGAAPRAGRGQHLGDALLGHQPPDHADHHLVGRGAEHPLAPAPGARRVDADRVEAAAGRCRCRAGAGATRGTPRRASWRRCPRGSAPARRRSRPRRRARARRPPPAWPAGRRAARRARAPCSPRPAPGPGGRPGGPYQPGLGLWVCTMSGRRRRRSRYSSAAASRSWPGAIDRVAWVSGTCADAQPPRAGDEGPRGRDADHLVARLAERLELGTEQPGQGHVGRGQVHQARASSSGDRLGAHAGWVSWCSVGLGRSRLIGSVRTGSFIG